MRVRTLCGSWLDVAVQLLPISAVKLSTLEPKDRSLRSYYNHPKTSTEPCVPSSQFAVGAQTCRLELGDGECNVILGSRDSSCRLRSYPTW